MSPDRMKHIVRVRLVRGHEELINKFKELRLRAKVVKEVAKIYIDYHVQDLANRPGVLKIHAHRRGATVRASLHSHVDARVDELYPSSRYDDVAGGIMPEIQEMVKEQLQRAMPRSGESAVDNKQSTMPDAAGPAENVFEGARPSIVVGEASTQEEFRDETLAESALGQICDLQVKMANKFEDQFVSKYLPRIFPWALKFDCGGAEYPDLFSDWDALAEGCADYASLGIQERWRRIANEAVVTPGTYAQMLATRAEAQIAGDWMLVPAARNLHWRYAVLRRSVFL